MPQPGAGIARDQRRDRRDDGSVKRPNPQKVDGDLGACLVGERFVVETGLGGDHRGSHCPLDPLGIIPTDNEWQHRTGGPLGSQQPLERLLEGGIGRWSHITWQMSGERLQRHGL